MCDYIHTSLVHISNVINVQICFWSPPKHSFIINKNTKHKEHISCPYVFLVFLFFFCLLYICFPLFIPFVSFPFCIFFLIHFVALLSQGSQVSWVVFVCQFIKCILGALSETPYNVDVLASSMVLTEQTTPETILEKFSENSASGSLNCPPAELERGLLLRARYLGILKRIH